MAVHVQREERPEFSIKETGRSVRVNGYYTRYNFAIDCFRSLDPQPEWASRLKMIYTKGPRFDSHKWPVKFMEGWLTKLCFFGVRVVGKSRQRPPAPDVALPSRCSCSCRASSGSPSTPPFLPLSLS